MVINNVEPRAVRLCDLPDSLLGAVFALVGREDGRCLPQVSRRFHRIFYLEPALWRAPQLSFTRPFILLSGHGEHPARWVLDPALPAVVAFLSGQARLLARVGPLVESLEVRGVGLQQEALDDPNWRPGRELRLPALLRSLRPGTLRQLRLCCEPHRVTGWMRGLSSEPRLNAFKPLRAEAIQQLPRLRAGLTALQLESWHLPAGTGTALRRLTNLRSLQLRGRELPAGLVASLLGLPLKRLWVESTMELPNLRVLTQLTTLEELRLSQGNTVGARLLAPAPCQLPRLSAFLFENERGPISVPGCALRRAAFNCGPELQPPYLRLQAGMDVEFDPDSTGPNSNTLALSYCHFEAPPASLARQLDWLLPPGVPLHRLQLHMFGESFSADSLQGCSRLADLRTLVLHTHCGVGEGGDEQALEGLLSQAPHLTALRLAHMRLEAAAIGGVLPACLANHAGLRRLSLENDGLPDLLPPNAPLFQTLEELDLASNSLLFLPALLNPASAPALRTLSLHRNDRLVIDGPDVDRLLRLPSLMRLDLRRIGHMWPADLVRLGQDREAHPLSLIVDSAADHARDREAMLAAVEGLSEAEEDAGAGSGDEWQPVLLEGEAAAGEWEDGV